MLPFSLTANGNRGTTSKDQSTTRVGVNENGHKYMLLSAHKSLFALCR